MLKRGKIVILIICLFIVGNTIGFIMSRENSYKFIFYIGDRFHYNISIKIDKKDYDVKTVFVNEEEKKLKSNEISVDGEDHKDYILKVIIKNEDLKEMINDEFFKDWNKDVYVNIDYISANWWNVVDIDSSINIDKDANGWYVEIITDYKEKNENWYGEPYISTKSEKKYLQEGNDVTTFLIL